MTLIDYEVASMNYLPFDIHLVAGENTLLTAFGKADMFIGIILCQYFWLRVLQL